MVTTPIQVDLDPWEYEWASHVGARRYIENWGKGNAAHYDASRMEDDRTAQVAACVCELAVAKHTNRYWSGSVWKVEHHDRYKHLADVGRNIEVRRLRSRDTVAIRKHQVGLGLVLFVAKPVMPELRQVNIYGWLPYDDAWEMGEQSDYAPTTTRVLHYDNFRL
jgi:hypothetical protein